MEDSASAPPVPQVVPPVPTSAPPPVSTSSAPPVKPKIKPWLIILLIFSLPAVTLFLVVRYHRLLTTLLPSSSSQVQTNPTNSGNTKAPQPRNTIKQISTSSNLSGYSIGVDQEQVIKLLQALGIEQDGVRLRTREGGMTPNYIFDKINLTLTGEIQPYGQYLSGNTTFASVSETVANQTLNMSIQIDPSTLKQNDDRSLSLLADRIFIQELYLLHNLGLGRAADLMEKGASLADQYKKDKVFLLQISR